MNIDDQQKTDELRTQLEDVLQRCPVEHCHPEDSLLYPLVRMQQSARAQWLNCLSLESLGFLAAYHYVCLGNILEALATKA